jgi:NitT/TauT family transport system substrate-binding protein
VVYPKSLSMHIVWAVGALLAIGLNAQPASAQDKFSFGLTWSADAERGGYYQAVAAGIYKRNNLDVTLVPGGPQVNNPQLLVAGQLDGVLFSSSGQALGFAANGIPLVVVAAIYQKHPRILLAHKSAGYKSLADMKGKPIMVGQLQRLEFWPWLRAKYGFTDDQLRPYTFNYGVFMHDPKAIQQDFITSGPWTVKREGGDPAAFLLADEGYDEYHALIAVRRETLEKRRDVVQRFVNATIEGWYSFLSGDPAPGITLIKKENPSQTDELISAARQSLIDANLIDSGDAKTVGIGALSDKRWQDWFEQSAKAGIVPPGDYWKAAYDVSLVNKKVGMK